MNPKNQKIKIYCFSCPNCYQFQDNQFKTMNSFQQKLQEIFKIEINNQKILLNGKVLKLRAQFLFKQLKLNQESVLRLLTVSPGTVKKLAFQQIQLIQNQPIKQISISNNEQPQPKQQKQEMKQEPQKVIIKEIHQQQSKPISQQQSKPISQQPSKPIQQQPLSKPIQQQPSSKSIQQIYSVYSLKQIAVDELISNLITTLKIPDRQLLLLNPSKLKFILAKMSPGNIALQKIILQKINIVKMSLIDANQISKQKKIPSTYIQQQLDDLKPLGFQDQNIIKALQISRNNIEIALDILNKSSFQQYNFQFSQLKSETIIDQYESIYLWFSQPNNQNHVKLIKSSQSYLQIYLNSLKHTCPNLFTTMLRWHPYLKRLILNLQKIPRKSIPSQ